MSSRKTFKVPKMVWFRATPDSEDARLEIIAADNGADEKKLPEFRMTAYTGAAMQLGYWPHPVVVDLKGLKTTRKPRPVFRDHDMGRVVGHTDTITNDGQTLKATGVVSGAGQDAIEVIVSSNNKFPWQASIGASVNKVQFIKEGKQYSANGRTFTGPLFAVKSSQLAEISFVALGADDDTSASVIAAMTGSDNTIECEENDMEFEVWLEANGFTVDGLNDSQINSMRSLYERSVGMDEPAMPTPLITATAQPLGNTSAQPMTMLNASAGQSKPLADEPVETQTAVESEISPADALKAERKRVSDIQALCAGEYVEVEREAIKHGWSVDETSRRLLSAVRSARPSADVHIRVSGSRGEQFERRTLEAAFCMRAGLTADELISEFGEPVIEAAYKERDLSLQQLFIECARMEGRTIPRSFGNDTIAAAFSTVSLPGILNNVANKRLLKSFNSQPIVATQLCSQGDLADFKVSERYRLTDVGDLMQVSEDGELKHGGLKEDRATNQLRTFGKTFSLTREMIFNDDLGAFLKVPDGMGGRSARKIDQLFFTRLLSNPVQPDGKNLFHADHANYIDGADSALSIDGLAHAIQLFLDQTDSDKQPINVNPKFLLVPTALKMTGRELLKSVTLFAVGDTDERRIPTYNPISDEGLQLVVSPYLTNANYSGYSAKAWYLFADPTIIDTFEIGYLRGKRAPTIEQGETDFDTLGIRFRVYFDLGVREEDHRGVCKFKGE